MTVLSYMARQRANLRARHTGETFLMCGNGVAVRIECGQNDGGRCDFVGRSQKEKEQAFSRREGVRLNRGERSESVGAMRGYAFTGRADGRSSDTTQKAERSAEQILSEFSNLRGLNKRERCAYAGRCGNTAEAQRT